MSQKVAIVTAVHNRKETTLLCLRSLSRIEKQGLDTEVIVVDDGSTDGTSAAIREMFPDVRLIPGDGNLWFTEGTNVAVREALKTETDYVLMINDDTVFDPGFLKSMVETAARNPRSVVGALLLLWDTPHRVFQVSPEWSVSSGGWRHWQHQTVWTVPERPWKVDLIVGNCVLVPVEAITENGLMNSRRYPNFGDAEYTPRLKRAGWDLLIDPAARAFCQPNTVPVRLRSLGFPEKLDALFLDLGNIHNLRRRFYACIDGGPSFFRGISAFAVFLFRLLIRKNIESSWAETLTEPPLSERFSDSVIE